MLLLRDPTERDAVKRRASAKGLVACWILWEVFHQPQHERHRGSDPVPTCTRDSLDGMGHGGLPLLFEIDGLRVIGTLSLHVLCVTKVVFTITYLAESPKFWPKSRPSLLWYASRRFHQ